MAFKGYRAANGAMGSQVSACVSFQTHKVDTAPHRWLWVIAAIFWLLAWAGACVARVVFGSISNACIAIRHAPRLYRVWRQNEPLPDIFKD